MPTSLSRRPDARQSSDAGFSLAELMVATSMVLLIFGIVATALMHMTNQERTIWNRTEMHSGVRGATELLQQEVGQAGLVSLPAPVTLTATIAPGVQTVGVSSTLGMFVGEQLLIDTGDDQETATLTAVDTGGNQITGSFRFNHVIGRPVSALGGFASGIVPPSMTNGSTGNVLKMYGDINSDGNMVYIEYTCDTANHLLYRNVMAWNATSKPAPTSAQILLTNIMPNPGGTACFIYQPAVVGLNTYITDVAISLTVQTQQVDPITKLFQKETKTLLNVSPRNIFNVWELASIGMFDRVQPMPPSIQALLQ